MGKLDYEYVQLYQLNVSAVDASNSEIKFTTLVTVNIKVEDSNDNDPILKPYTHLTIEENIGIGQVVATINCTDIDSGDNGQINVIINSVNAIDHNGKANNNLLHYPFTLDVQTETIVVSGTIDFELIPYYQINIKCHDNGIPHKRSSSSIVFVTVVNLNEHPPSFIYKVMELYISTDVKLNEEVITLLAMYR